MAEPHDQYRHRLRLRRPPDRPALPGARAGLGAGRPRSTASRSGRSLPDGPSAAGAARRATTARPRRRARQAHHRRRAARHRHDPRGERRRRARGDEPLRRRPAVARSTCRPRWRRRRRPRARGCSSTPPRRSRTSARDGVARGGVRGEAHGLAGRRRRVPRRRRRAARGSASTGGEPGICYTRTGRPFFDGRRDLEGALLDRVRAAVGAPGSGTSWRPTGSCSTPSCCRGRPRPRSCCAASTPPSVPPRRAALARVGPRARSGRRHGAPRQACRSGARERLAWPSTSSRPTAATAGR